MRKDIELLAPCGTYEAFIAAIENGANAVYLGGKMFNARANASNFDLNELSKMVEYAHLREVKIFVTLNTLLSNDEVSDALSFAYDLYNIGIDAVIVQDLGLARVLHKYIPNLELHASTQMTIYNIQAIKELEKIGFKRIVLARELSFEEIRYICDNTSLEIEIFIHGALCISYSGQCLMSSMIGDRSGNRGKCAQPCRLPYTLLENEKSISNGFLLSPKDLSTISLLKELPNVKSLKIEGRMKSPEYVATTTRIYRKYLDKLINSENSSVTDEDNHDLSQIFNRGGFTTAYLEKKQGTTMMSYERPKNWGIFIGNITSYDNKRYITVTNSEKLKIGDGIEIVSKDKTIFPSTIISEIENNKIGRIHGEINVGDKVYKTLDKALMQKARESFTRNSTRKTAVNVEIKIKKNEEIVVKIGSSFYKSGITPDVAQNSPITRDKIIEQFSKTGDSPFQFEEINLELDDNLFLPISVINSIRRNALIEYQNYVMTNEIHSLEKQSLKRNYVKKSRKPSNVSLCIKYLNNNYNALENINSIYVPLKEVLIKEDEFIKLKFKKYILLPTITKSNYEKVILRNIEKLSKICDGFIISNIGQLEYFKNIETELIANYTLNAFNDFTIEYLTDLGFKKVTLSPELTEGQINSLSYDIPSELIVYGNQCVMTSEHCPVGNIVGNFSCKNNCSKPCISNNKYYLKDRMNMLFRVIPDNIDCQSTIYNSKITSIESKNLQIDSIRIDIIDENIEEIQNIINLHKSGKKLSGEQYTNGHINRIV